MASSIRFHQFENRVKDLETNLLPAINNSGNYTSKDLDLTRAFCLLSHAEIEAYLEDILHEVVKAVYVFWKADNSKIPEIIFNLACNHKNKSDKRQPPADAVHEGFKHLEDIIKKNHGIKMHNIESLFSPIGYSIDQTLVTVLHNFGATRGDIAHKSFQTQQQIDPQSEKNNVNNIVKELDKFDVDFYKYTSPINNYSLPKKTTWWSRVLKKIVF